MTRAAPPVAVWGAGTPVSTALAEGLRQHDLEAMCVAGLRTRPGVAHRTVIFPIWDGRATEDPAERRARLAEEARTLLCALEDGRLERLIVISCTGAYGPSVAAESDPLAATEGDTYAADAVAVEALLGTALAGSAPRDGLTVLRPALLVGVGCETSLFARHLAGPRLLVVRGTTPRWQVCHIDDLCGALAHVLAGATLDRPAVVACRGVLDQAGLEQACGRRRMELPSRVAEATAARLRRTRLSPAAPDELPLLARPVVVEPMLLTRAGFIPRHDAAGAVRAHLLAVDPAHGATGTSRPSGPQAATLAGATVAVVGSAALLRRARRQRGLRAG